MDESFSSRVDLAVALIDGNTGLWDSRMDVLQLGHIHPFYDSTIWVLSTGRKALTELESLESIPLLMRF